MKTRILSIILTLALLLSTLSGCGGETEPVSGKTETQGKEKTPGITETPGKTDASVSSGMGDVPDENADPVTEMPEEPEELYPTPDYSGFEMPAATDSLTVYAYSFISSILTTAVELFKAKYPNVQVDYQILGEDEYDSRLRAEIPAGRGPDLLIGESALLPDVYKTMSTGIFTDLGGYMEKDEEYEPSDYNEGVMKGGLLYGRQVIMPLTFSSSCVITSEELLAENGLTAESMRSWQGFCDACKIFHENHPDAALFAHGGNGYYLTTLYPYIGFRMIDYEKNAVSFDEERFRGMIDLSRLYCYPDIPKEPKFGEEQLAVHNGNCFFINENTTIISTVTGCLKYRVHYNETPVMLAIPDEHDGVTARIEYYGAVPESSQNKLNAWRLMKILLSHEIQYGEERENDSPKTTYPIGFPVRKESLRKALDSNTYWNGADESDVESFWQLMESVTDSVILPTVIRNYIINDMKPYITSKDGSNYDKQFTKLMNELELYKDE